MVITAIITVVAFAALPLLLTRVVIRVIEYREDREFARRVDAAFAAATRMSLPQYHALHGRSQARWRL